MEYVFAPAADGQFGNAILSDLPMEEIDSGLLPDDGSQERSYLVVEVTTAAGPVRLSAPMSSLDRSPRSPPCSTPSVHARRSWLPVT